MKVPWGDLFENFGIKRVSKTDKEKAAYLPNSAQRIAIAAAGIEPEAGQPFKVTILLDSELTKVSASYYLSARSEEAARDPEPRMGREFISSWAERGDVLVIGNIGNTLFAAKEQQVDLSPQLIGQILARAKGSDRRQIIDKAKKARGRPKRTTRVVNDFVRNPHVVAAALIRAEGKCEFPRCKSALFKREDGTAFLEVHHVIPLAENGADELGNAAALCPMCHRELHFGKLRAGKRVVLAQTIAAKAF